MTEKLPLDAKISLISKMVDDLSFYKEAGSCPVEQHFKIVSSDEDVFVESRARYAALQKMAAPIKKVAFDTRRIDQETDRNPRRNLQYWHRSEDFIDDETSDKLKIFDKLDKVVKNIQSELEKEPEWFDSYARILSSNLDRLEVKTAEGDSVEVFKPHVSYLEQLIYNRYRLTLEDIKTASDKEIRDRVMSKDEELERRGEFLKSVGSVKKNGDDGFKDQLLLTMANMLANGNSNGNPIVIQQPQESGLKDAAASIFSSPTRNPGEKSVERTITIKIVDSVVD